MGWDSTSEIEGIYFEIDICLRLNISRIKLLKRRFYGDYNRMILIQYSPSSRCFVL